MRWFEFSSWYPVYSYPNTFSSKSHEFWAWKWMILNAVEVPSFLYSSLGGLVDSVLDMLSDGRELNSWQIHGVYPRHLHIQTPLRRMAGVLTHEGHSWALTIPGGKPSRVVSYTAHIQHIVRIELATLDHRAFLFPR